MGKPRSVVEIVEECRKLSVMAGKDFYKCLEEKGLLKRIPKPAPIKEPVFTIPEMPNKNPPVKEPEFTIPETPEKKPKKKKPPIEIQPIPIEYAK